MIIFKRNEFGLKTLGFWITVRTHSLWTDIAFWNAILLYWCKAWFLTQALASKLDTFARKCYWIMLGICRAETLMTDTDLYRMTDEHPISEMIREHQLQFTEHCFCMPNDKCSSSPNIVSACQMINQLTFMSSIRARCGSIAAEIQASHI